VSKNTKHKDGPVCYSALCVFFLGSLAPYLCCFERFFVLFRKFLHGSDQIVVLFMIPTK
jgi:hypothetical protein